jgi:WD40 repeat protein
MEARLMIHFSCPHCKTGLKTGSGAGNAARCPNCLELIEIPKLTGQSAPLSYTEQPSASLSAVPLPPTRLRDTQGPAPQRRQRKTNVLLLGFAAACLACAGFMIVDFVGRSDTPNKPLRGNRAGLGRVGPPTAAGAPAHSPFVYKSPNLPKVKMAEALAGKPRVRLGTLRFRHGGQVRALALSSGSNILASCGMDGEVRLWNADTGELLRRLSGSGEPLQCVALSPDGYSVAAGGQKLYLWETASGRQVTASLTEGKAIVGVAFSPDGQTLASVCLGRAFYSPDGRLQATGGTDSEICLWNVPAVTKRWSQPATATGLFFSPDGETLATFVRSFGPTSPWPGGSVMLLDAATGRPRVSQLDDISGVLALSPDAGTLATVGRDGTVRLREVATGKKLHTFAGHSQMVNRVAFSQDGKTLATISSDVRVWDIATEKEVCRFERARHPVAAIVFSNDGKTIYTADDDHVIHRWKTTTGDEILNDDGQGAVAAVAISPNGKTVVTTGKDAILHVWDLTAGQRVYQYEGHQRPVQCVAYSGDGSLLASAASQYGDSRSSEVRLWDVGSGRVLHRWDGSTEPVVNLHFRPDDQSLAAVEGRQGRVHIWKTATGAELHQFGGSWAHYSSFSPDGALLALWGFQMVQIWDMAGRYRVVSELQPAFSMPTMDGAQGYRGILLSAQALSPGGRYLACAARHENGMIRVFKVPAGEVIDLPIGHAVQPWREPVSALAWSHDGKTLASGGGDGQVWLWDVATATALRRYPGHEGRVTTLAFSSDDRTLVSGSDDTTALVWDLTGPWDLSTKPEVKRQPR